MEDYSMHSPYWAYNHPNWKPTCVRCRQKKDNCKKYNSTELGSFAGSWICESCVLPEDYKTPAQLVIDRQIR